MDNRLKDSIREGVNSLRASCHFQKGEPLLVFYDGPFARMLGLQELPEYFTFTWGVLTFSHTVSDSPLLSFFLTEKDGAPMKRMKRGTNFHSLARDVEQEWSGLSEEGRSGRLDKHDNEANEREEFLLGMASEFRSAVWKRVKAELLEAKRSAFTEVYRTRSAGDQRAGLPGSAFSPVPSRSKMDTIIKSGKVIRSGEPREATDLPADHGGQDFLTPRDYLPFPKSLTILPLSEMWPKCETPPSPQVLPPTFTTLGSTAQIWCAKCKLSFRMTSDLVLHMRLRHKKEARVETQGKRPRELQLSCPVCYANFRERHHLSRHMTSHC
ncbi:zinc finger protein 488 [Leptodactylus fuscus]